MKTYRITEIAFVIYWRSNDKEVSKLGCNVLWEYLICSTHGNGKLKNF